NLHTALLSALRTFLYSTQPLASLRLNGAAGSSPFLSAGRAQNIAEPVVSLVAPVLERRLRLILRQVHRERPRLRPRGRIIERDRPLDLVGADRLEPFDETQLLARSAVGRLRQEVRGLDDQRAAVPAAARVAHVRFDLRPDVLASVERDDPRLVNHL